MTEIQTPEEKYGRAARALTTITLDLIDEGRITADDAGDLFQTIIKLNEAITKETER